jgi:hypothetical protein
LEMDFTDVEAWEAGEILPAGTHDVTVIKAEESMSSSGNPQLELELEAFEGPNKGGRIRDWITVIPTTAGKVKQVLTALGLEVDGKYTIDPDNLVGRKAQILVRNELYDGKERSKVKGYEPSGATGGASPPSTNGAKKDEEDLPF